MAKSIEEQAGVSNVVEMISGTWSDNDATCVSRGCAGCAAVDDGANACAPMSVCAARICVHGKSLIRSRVAGVKPSRPMKACETCAAAPGHMRRE